MRHNALEVLLSALVLAAAGSFLAFALAVGRPGPVTGYSVSAQFSDAGGLKAGDVVAIGGIPVGSVTAVAIDPRSLGAVAAMSIRNDIRLPSDTVAAVVGASPLGGKRVSLLPGHSRAVIPPGGRVTRTKAYRSLEETVGREIFGGGLGGP